MVGEELAEYDEVAGVLNASCTTAGLKIWRNISKSAATLDFDDDDEELFDEDSKRTSRTSSWMSSSSWR